jgi:GNAT superfamily N-acetyltransferase
MSEPARLLEWDSEFFGLRIGRVQGEPAGETAFRSIDAWARDQGMDCLYLLLDAGNGASIRSAEEHGFRLADIRVSLEHRLTETPAAPAAGPRACTPEDLPELKRHARLHHEATRFFRDARFPRERAAELYALWLEKTFASPRARVFMTERDGLPTGYIACEIEPENKGRISLAGVDPLHRGQGIGTRLVQSALHWLGQNGALSRRVVTQGANIPALRLYASNGFYPVRTELWYHKWFDRVPS